MGVVIEAAYLVRWPEPDVAWLIQRARVWLADEVHNLEDLCLHLGCEDEVHDQSHPDAVLPAGSGVVLRNEVNGSVSLTPFQASDLVGLTCWQWADWVGVGGACVPGIWDDCGAEFDDRPARELSARCGTIAVGVFFHEHHDDPVSAVVYDRGAIVGQLQGSGVNALVAEAFGVTEAEIESCLADLSRSSVDFQLDEPLPADAREQLEASREQLEVSRARSCRTCHGRGHVRRKLDRGMGRAEWGACPDCTRPAPRPGLLRQGNQVIEKPPADARPEPVPFVGAGCYVHRAQLEADDLDELLHVARQAVRAWNRHVAPYPCPPGDENEYAYTFERDYSLGITAFPGTPIVGVAILDHRFNRDHPGAAGLWSARTLSDPASHAVHFAALVSRTDARRGCWSYRRNQHLYSDRRTAPPVEQVRAYRAGIERWTLGDDRCLERLQAALGLPVQADDRFWTRPTLTLSLGTERVRPEAVDALQAARGAPCGPSAGPDLSVLADSAGLQALPTAESLPWPEPQSGQGGGCTPFPFERLLAASAGFVACFVAVCWILAR